MGKYMKNAKTTGDVGVMDVSQTGSFGVRTRAKTLALQRQARLLQSPARPPPSQSPQPASSAGGSYLQLRSRRLEKPAIIFPSHDSSKRQRQVAKEALPNPNPTRDSHSDSNLKSRVRLGQSDSGWRGSGQKNEANVDDKVKEMEDEIRENSNNHNNESKDFGMEPSFGENILEMEGRESTRESTPCSLIRDPDAVRTPGSTTRRTSTTETNRRLQNSMHRHIPTAREMDEFFAEAEQEQQRQFIEKYNFDPVNDKPLPGRYAWEKLDP